MSKLIPPRKIRNKTKETYLVVYTQFLAVHFYRIPGAPFCQLSQSLLNALLPHLQIYDHLLSAADAK